VEDDVSGDGFEGEEFDFFGGVVVGDDGGGRGGGRGGFEGGKEERSEGGFGTRFGWGGGGGFDLIAHLSHG